MILFFCFKLEAKDYSKFFINDKCGLIDENRKIILEPVFKDFYKYGDSYPKIRVLIRNEEFLSAS